jgi:hypothetical protein
MVETPAVVIGTWVAAGLTLMMFSFIYKDNRFFKFGEHLYLGISIGYYVNVQYFNVLYPDVIRAITVEHLNWVIIPAILGIFVLLRLVPSLSWLSRMSFALYIGGAAGLAIPNVIHGLLLPQLTQTLVPFQGPVGLTLLAMALIGGAAALLARSMELKEVWSGALAALLAVAVIGLAMFNVLNGANNNLIIILIAVFSTLIFFFFSLEHKKMVGGISRIGLVFIMVSFGASFGYTVMARISLLIGRFQFLLFDWLKLDRLIG